MHIFFGVLLVLAATALGVWTLARLGGGTKGRWRAAGAILCVIGATSACSAHPAADTHPTRPHAAAGQSRSATPPPSPSHTRSAAPTPAPSPTEHRARSHDHHRHGPAKAAVAAGVLGTVTGHVDGDTIHVDGDSVRLIGVDTPETVDPDEPVACYGRVASATTARLLPVGSKVRLRFDAERRDRYGRTLAYVYRAGDGMFVNAWLVSHGYAKTLTIPPDVTHAGRFARLQARAQRVSAGLWGRCAYFGQPAHTSHHARPKAVRHAKPTPQPADNCDPNYSGACIPPSPPDHDCGEISARNFHVVGTDDQRFDSNGDGIACET